MGLLDHAMEDDGAGDMDLGADDRPDHGQAKMDAMKAFVSAVHSRDVEGALTHFETLCGLCEYDEGGGEKPEGGKEREGGHALLLMPAHKE